MRKEELADFGFQCRPVNPLLTVKDILHCLTLVQPTHIAVSGAYHDKVQEALKQHNSVASTRVFSVLDRIEGVLKVSLSPILLTT